MTIGTDGKSDDEKSRQELIAELRDLRAKQAGAEIFKRARTDVAVSTGAVTAQVINDALDATPALIAFIDTELRYRYVNEAYERWFGLSTDGIIGRLVEDIIDPAAYAVFRKGIDRVYSGE